jgi:hypothetical protein
MTKKLKESKSDQSNKQQEKSGPQIVKDQQELTPHLDLDGGLLDLIVLDEAGEHTGGHRPYLAVLLDRYTRAYVRVKIIKVG